MPANQIKWFCIVTACCVAPTTLDVHAQSSPDPTPTEIVSKYEQSLAPLRRFTAQRIQQHQSGRISRDGKEELQPYRNDQPAELRVDNQQLFVKNEIRGDDKLLQLDERILGSPEAFDLRIYNGERKSIDAIMWQQNRQDIYIRYENLGMLLGYWGLKDARTVAQLLRDATDLHRVDSPAQVQGVPVYSVQTKGTFGILTLSIGKLDGIARQISFERHKGDLNDWGMLMGDDDPLYEGDAPIAETLIWSDAKVQMIDGKPVPIGGKRSIRATYLRNEYPTLDVETTELRNINLKPDFTASSFRPDIPEGATVRVDGNWQTPYVWHNGQVIKRSDLRAAMASSEKSLGVVWTDWRVICLVCLILLTIPITLASWYIRRRKPKAV